MITIRREKSTDPAAIRRVLDSSFGRNDEASMVEAMRLRGVLSMSLVAVKADNTVGHIAFTAATIDANATPKWLDDPPAAALDPAAAGRETSRADEPRFTPRGPDIPWVSLEETFEKEQAAWEMAEMAEAAERAAKEAMQARRRSGIPVQGQFAPIPQGGQQAPRFVVLAPVAVMPNHRNRGLGGKLVLMGMRELAKLQCQAVFVLGDPSFYGRFGFQSTRPYGIGCEIPVKSDVFQVRMLTPTALEGVRGVVRFEPELRSLG
jgi:predicted N-acetyltransferase YhbS